MKQMVTCVRRRIALKKKESDWFFYKGLIRSKLCSWYLNGTSWWEEQDSVNRYSLNVGNCKRGLVYFCWNWWSHSTVNCIISISYADHEYPLFPVVAYAFREIYSIHEVSLSLSCLREGIAQTERASYRFYRVYCSFPTSICSRNPHSRDFTATSFGFQ